MDIRVALICGADIPVPECQLIVHQPKIKDIALIGEETLFMGAQCLNVSKNLIQVQDKNILQDINNFQIFMMIMAEKEAVEKKIAVQKVFDLIFPDYKIMFTPRSLLFQKEGQEMITVDENNFSYIQEIVKEIFCLRSSLTQSGSFNPADQKAKEIADNIARGRQRVAAQNGETNSSMFVQYISILTVGLQSMSLQDCCNLTMYQMLDLVERYSLYTNWDIDIRARLAGASPDEKPDNWMKNIH